MIRPGIRLIWLIVVPLACAIAALFLSGFGILAWGSFVLLIVVALVDLGATVKGKEVGGRREAAGTFAVGVRQHVDLFVYNHGPRPALVTVFDHFPAQHVTEGMPTQTISLVPGKIADFRYGFTPIYRGSFTFGRIQLRIKSPLQLWERSVMVGEPHPIRVYPDYAQVLQSGTLAACQRLDMIGIHRNRRRGEGTEFHQLRHFRPGDRLNQINWKSTAKHRQLISNQYQEERDQRVLVLIDCSHRMRSRDGQTSHFDQALNAAILLSWFATRQGDAVGLMTFGSEELRYVQPAKTPAVVSRMLDCMFDLQPSDASPDYRTTFTRVLTMMRKRSLIVVLTTLRDEAKDELGVALKPLLSRHLVCVANIRETVLDHIEDTPVQTMEDAYAYLGAKDYAAGVNAAVATVQSTGCSVVHSTAKDLPVSVTNHYLGLKRSGRM